MLSGCSDDRLVITEATLLEFLFVLFVDLSVSGFLTCVCYVTSSANLKLLLMLDASKLINCWPLLEKTDVTEYDRVYCVLVCVCVGLFK